jgi:hypothetical protein
VSETKGTSWWLGLEREKFNEARLREEMRMRNTRLPKPVSTYLAALQFIEERELRGLPTPRQPITPASPTPSSTHSASTFDIRGDRRQKSHLTDSSFSEEGD